jgi:hypothetical protein
MRKLPVCDLGSVRVLVRGVLGDYEVCSSVGDAYRDYSKAGGASPDPLLTLESGGFLHPRGA